jgi:hypothetical protein
LTISDDETVYGDEELALILHKAAELARLSKAERDSSSGLSLEEIKTVGAEVGLDPSLIERAARLIPQGPESRLERLIGGPLQHRRDVRVRTTLTAEKAAHLLATVRGIVEVQGEGQSDASGMSWHSKGGAVHTSVTANAETGGIRVRVRVDRRGMSFLTAFSSVVATVPFASPLIDAGPSIISIALAVLPVAVGRVFWVYSTRRARDRVEALVDTVGRSLAETSRPAPPPEANRGSRQDDESR